VEDLQEEAIRLLRDADDAKWFDEVSHRRRGEIEWPKIPEDFESFTASCKKK
jgi:hypothetical protein